MEVFRAVQAPMRIIMRSDGSTASQLRDVFVSQSDILEDLFAMLSERARGRRTGVGRVCC
jgi:hypothetical protein